MPLGFLEFHLQMKHGKATGGRRHWGTMAPSREPRTYKMDLPTAGGTRNFPIKGCREWGATRMAMRDHSYHWHAQDTMIILEKGNLPHPQCPRCDMLFTWRALNGRHLNTSQCTKGE